MTGSQAWQLVTARMEILETISTTLSSFIFAIICRNLMKVEFIQITMREI
jgi:hypothetical protein